MFVEDSYVDLLGVFPVVMYGPKFFLSEIFTKICICLFLAHQ